MPGVGLPAARRQWLAAIGDHVVSAGWSADGTMVAAAGVGGALQVLRACDGQLVATLAGHSFGASAIAWHPSESLLASIGQDGHARLWRPREPAPLWSVETGAQWGERIAWSPDGKRLATTAGRKVRSFLPDGALACSHAETTSTAVDLVWRRRGQQFAVAAYGAVLLFGPAEPEPQASFEWKGSMLSVAWSPDGRIIVTGNQDSSVHLWFVASGEDLHMSGYATKVKPLSWSADSRYLATGGAADVIVWDCSGRGPAGRKPIQLVFHSELVTQLAFRPRGRMLASGCAGGQIAFWAIGRHSAGPIATASLGAPISVLDWARDGERLIVATADGAFASFTPPTE